MIIVFLLMAMLIILNCGRTSFINVLVHSASRVLTIVNFSERNKKIREWAKYTKFRETNLRKVT